MYGTCARLDLRFSPSSTAFSLAIVTGIKVAKTVTSFLTLISFFEDTNWYNGLFSYSGSTSLRRYLFFLFWE